MRTLDGRCSFLIAQRNQVRCLSGVGKCVVGVIDCFVRKAIDKQLNKCLNVHIIKMNKKNL